ncbi:MAG: hypothetical protein KKA28_08175 [Planctomycetes bacterium]|nr:hypothetical protein [Planctomycetota bacterium]MCG2683360.1 hypothetical protein [Planctomycetales bacterium]
MDFVDRAYSQLQNLFRSMTPAARWTAGLLAVVVIVGLGYLGTHRSAKPDADLMRGVSITPAQLPAMEAALAKANLTDYEIRGTSIFVPRGREAVYMAALADANALPPQPGDALTDAVRNGNPFMSSRAHDELIKKATQAELSLMIRSMSGIENAYVIYDVDTKPGFNKDKLITATASVKPVGTAQLDEARVSSIRHLVAGAIAGLKPENVTVSDRNGRTWHGKLEETAKNERHTAQSPPPNQGNENLADSGGATPLKDVRRRETPPTDFAQGASRWLVQPWSTIGLIGLALVGLLVLRSIVRGASVGAKQTTASMSADGVDAPARSRASAVPAPHWLRPTDAADRSPGEELSELVDEDPEAAANILRNWIGQAS